MLENVKIILVETTHSGNIGSVARAMKTMGLSRLCLVNPQVEVDAQAMALAAGASDIIQQATEVSDLAAAIAQSRLVLGTSARPRNLDWPLLSARQAAERVTQQILQSHTEVALVFGRERVGLTNQELQLCDYHLAIPANPDYSSLNLAMAVQIVTYELRMAWLASNASLAQPDVLPKVLPTHQDREFFYRDFAQLLTDIQFIRAGGERAIMSRIRRLINRTELDERELNILRGIVATLLQRVK